MKLLILALTVSAVYASTLHVGLDFKPSQEKRQLYSSKLLHHVQMSGVFPNSKTFVDMRMKRDEKTILLAFDELLAKTHERPSKEQLAEFINYNFDSESGLELWRPSDFVSEPSFLNSIKDSELKVFARNVYNMLPSLGRKLKPIVFKNPEQFSSIPVHNGFIVPGGKSKEFNYMESYWIIESLLISGMKETAKGMISNFIELQREFGYIPSGDRYYYLGRSQPPLLSAMMAIYIQETNDIEFLRANIDAIEGELEYWLDTHSVLFEVAGREHSLLRYITKCRGPRPEEYYHDFKNAQVFDNEQRQEQFYTDMKAAAESGWVLSSRWIVNKNGSNLGDLSWMHTSDIVPVDLNAIFASAVQNVAHFYSVLNDARRGAHWLEIRKRWVNSIKEVLWNEEEGMWFDWDLSSSQHRKYFYTSNLSPLWMGVVEPEFMKAKSQLIINYLRKSHSLEYPGGVPASLVKSGYLYDLPYALPAQVSIVVSALEALQTEESSKMAFEVAQNLVRSMYKAFQSNRQLYAKYDVESPGKPLVASGEYLNEEAFAGTIGVIIEMLAKYGATMTSVKSFIPFPSKFGQYSQFYSTSAPQILNYQYSGFPAKPFVPAAKPESPIKNVYINDYKKPSIAPTYFAPTQLPSEPTKPTLAEVKPQHIVSFEEKPEVTTLKNEEYISTTYKPEYLTFAPIKPYQPIPTVFKFEKKPEYLSVSPVPQKPEILSVAPVPQKPGYLPAVPVQQKPEYLPVAPAPLKPGYVSVEVKPEHQLFEKKAEILPVAPVQQKPEILPAVPVQQKPEYLPVAPVPQKPEYLPVAPVPQKPEFLPVAPAPLKPGYVSVEVKPEHQLFEKKPEILPVAPVQQKPEILPVAPVPQKPEYLPVAPVPQKPEYLPVAPAPLKPGYVSVEVKPEHQLYEKKPEILPVVAVPLKQEYISVAAKPEPELFEKKPEYLPVAPVQLKPEILPVAPVPQKPEYLPVAPAPQKPEYLPARPENLPVAPVPQKPEYLSVAPVPQKPQYLPGTPAPQKPESLPLVPVPQKPQYLPIAPAPQKPESLPVAPVPQKPQYLSVAPAPQKPESLPVAPVPQKPAYLPVAPVPQKPLYVSVQVKPESQLLNKQPEYVSVVEAKPEVAPTAYPAKPLYTSSFVSKPEYVTAQPESLLLEKKNEYPVAEVKPEIAQTVYNKPLYPTLSPVKPSFVIEAKPEIVSPQYPSKPLYSKPVQISYVAPLSLKPEYVIEKNPEYSSEKSEEIISSTTLEPEYVSTTAQPELATLNPTKPAQVYYPGKPSQVSLYPAKPTFSSFPSWNKYSSVKVPFVSAIKPLTNVQAKPEYSSTTEFQSEQFSTTLAPEYESATEQLYQPKPTYVAALPIKHEYIHSEASLPVKEVNIQTSPIKPAYGSQAIYVSSAKPVLAPTKPSLVAAVPVQSAVSQQVSYASSSYRQPGYVVPAIAESKYPGNAAYESSTVAEPEYTSLASGEYTTYKPEYTTVAESEYPSTSLHSEFEYATTESQLVDVKPQSGYLSVQSKPQEVALSVSGSASTDKKPYFAGYSIFSSQKQEAPQVQTTYVSSVQSQASGVAELAPVVSVSIPARQQVQGEIASQNQASVLQQSHFSYFDKPAPVPAVVATPAPKPEGFSSFTKFNINSANATKVESSSSNTFVSSKPQYSSGAFSSGFVFNKTVTPSIVSSAVNVGGVPLKNNQKWPQSGQYVSSSSWHGSSYNKPLSYISKPNRWNTYTSQYQPLQSQYQGQYQAQYNSGAYNSGLYKSAFSSTAKPLVSSTYKSLLLALG